MLSAEKLASESRDVPRVTRAWRDELAHNGQLRGCPSSSTLQSFVGSSKTSACNTYLVPRFLTPFEQYVVVDHLDKNTDQLGEAFHDEEHEEHDQDKQEVPENDGQTDEQDGLKGHKQARTIGFTEETTGFFG